MSGADVTLTILDGGGNTAVNVPSTKTRVKIGCLLATTASWASSGANPTALANQIVSATQPQTLVPYFVGGKLMQAAGLICAAGGNVLAIGVPVVTLGTSTAVVSTVPGGSTSVVTVTLDPTNGAWDDANFLVKCTTGGTRGTAGIFLQISQDAGRNFGPTIALGTATTYKILDTGVQLNFAAGTLVAGDTWRFSTTAPKGNTAGWFAALTTLQGSQYALTGVGGTHLVDVVDGATASTLQGYLGGSPDGAAGLASNYFYTRMMVDVRDALTPTTWGGSGETEATWMAAISADYSATTAVRVCANAGAYNMPSAYANPATGAPSFRRNLAWALDVREVNIPVQAHAGKVSLRALGSIVVNPTTDPTDGFVYHDERLTPGLTPARFCAAKTRPGHQGYYIDQPNLMRGTGSVYTILPLGAVMDVGCFVVVQIAQEEIDEDVRLNTDGTLYAADRLAIQNDILNAINANMTAVNMLSPGSTVSITPDAPVGTNGNVPIAVSLAKRGYVLSETISIGFLTPSAAGG